MRTRLLALLLLTCAAGVGASLASKADESPAAARMPAIPAVQALAGTRCPIPHRLRPAFLDAAAETELPLALLTAVAQLESRAGAGDVLAGARYLRAQFDRFRSHDRALAAYNPNGDTLTYVADVTAVWRALAGCG